MLTRFFDNTIQTKFIKYFVSHFNIPIVTLWEPGLFVKQGNLCVYQNNLYQVKDSGSYKGIVTVGDQAHFEYLNPFIFGQEYRNLTTRYTGVTEAYDSTTHYYLGKYLRAVKAFFGLDLMYLYNCFNGVYIDDVDFGKPEKLKNNENPSLETLNIRNKQKAQSYKIFSVPIQFGKTYTIAIDSDSPIEIVPVIYGDKGLNEAQTLKLLSSGRTGYQKYESAHFQRMDVVFPAIEWVDDSTSTGEGVQELSQYERYLRLLVKVPQSNKSSFTVLEGSYTSGRVISRDVNGSYTEMYGNRPNPNLMSTPKLTFFNDGNIYAFSDSLIQYLLLNVICNMDTIDDNILRIQTYVTSAEFRLKNNSAYTLPYNSGVWDDSLQDFILKTVMQSRYLPIKLDKNGCVDTETESIILRGQSV